MSSLFNKHSEMFGVKKCFGNSVFNASSSNMLDENLLLSQDEGQDEPECVPESWIELTPSRISFCSSLAMDEANSSFGGINKDSQLSPISIQSSNVEFESNLEQVKYKLTKDVLPKNTDWIWDWSSRPEIFPTNSNLQQLHSAQLQQIESALTTPPNSPEPDLLVSENVFNFSLFKKSKKQPLLSSFLRFEVIVSLVMSNIMTFVLGATIGYFF